MRHSNDHLDEAGLLDAAEESTSARAAEHLAVCEHCRAKVAELRAAIHLAGDAPVPEPSPLFWEHFSARVSEAVANERAAEGETTTAGWLARFWNWQGAAAALAVAVVVLAVTIGRRPPDAPKAVEPPEASAIAASFSDLTPSLDDDPSLSFIADLAGDLDWDDAVEAGLTSGAGSVDRVVLDMSDDERRELQRVLQEAMRRPGA